MTMMGKIELVVLVYLLIWHFLADFIVQTDWQAQNKSKQLGALARHVFTYTLCLWVASLIVVVALDRVGLSYNPYWVHFFWVNGVLHWLTDYATSRWARRLYEQGRRRAFFIVVGFDQLIHQVTLIVTMAIWLL